jgi:hypothetical protein
VISTLSVGYALSDGTKSGKGLTMTHPTNLEHLAKDKIRTIRAEGLRNQQLKRRGLFAKRERSRPRHSHDRRGGRRGLVVKRTFWVAAGFAGLVVAAYWLF